MSVVSIEAYLESNKSLNPVPNCNGNEQKVDLEREILSAIKSMPSSDYKAEVFNQFKPKLEQRKFIENANALEHLSYIIDADYQVIKIRKQKKQEYIDLVVFLQKQGFIDKFIGNWEEAFMVLTKKLKSPIALIDALMLFLEKERFYGLKKLGLLSWKALEIAKTIPETQERIIITIRLLRYLSKFIKERTIPNLLIDIHNLSDEVVKIESLAQLLPYLSPSQRKKEFQITERVNGQINRTLALMAFAPYLTKARKRVAINAGLELIKTGISPREKALIIKQLIVVYGLFSGY